MDTPLLRLDDLSASIEGRKVLQNVTWTVRSDEQWVIVGPNGGGKSTLVAIAGLHRHPSSGSVEILGQQLGRVDIRPLRQRVGTSSAVLAQQLRNGLTAEEVVRCGRFGALEPWWHQYETADTTRAVSLLDQVGLKGMSHNTFGTLSSGERQRCLLARALMPDPAVLLLDEPTAGLDLTGREQLVSSLVDVANDPDGPVTALVTHHVEDIPPTTTHLLAIGDGSSIASGPIEETLTGELLSDLFSLPIELGRFDTPAGPRWSARAAH